MALVALCFVGSPWAAPMAFGVRAKPQAAEACVKMLGMASEFDELRRGIELALNRYGAWERPLRRYRAEEYRRLNSGGFTWEDYQSGLAKLEAELVAEEDPRSELYPLFERLCALYVVGGDGERAAIRAWAAGSKRLGQLLWRYANGLTLAVESAEGDRAKPSATADLRQAAGELVTRSLVAIAIDNCSANYRDTLMTLADLYVAAEEAGIDPRPLFEDAAAMATDEVTLGGCESLRAMLHEFHASATLRERRGMAGPYGGPA